MRNRKTYFLDLRTLLVYLNTQSCELTTELKVSGKTAKGSIILKEGKVIYCQLSLQGGLRITGEQAYQRLETCTEWQVELELPGEQKKDFLPTQFSPQLSPAPFLAVPSAPTDNLQHSPPLRQKRLLDPALLQPLPLKQRLILRSVFAMINGQRSTEEIKAQLHLPPGDIDVALTRLRALDLIE
jgi:hypothetical protein